MIDRAAATLSTEQVGRVLFLLRGAGAVELRWRVPDRHVRATVAGLGLVPGDAQVRSVAFFDTPDLALDRHGLVVRVQRRRGADAVTTVQLRPLVPGETPRGFRRCTGFTVELDARPGGYVCSGSMEGRAEDRETGETFAGRRPLRGLLTREQRHLLAQHGPVGLDPDDLDVVGPIDVVEHELAPSDLSHRITAEQWSSPAGGRVLELSTRCETTDAFRVAAEFRTFLARHGIDVGAVRETIRPVIALVGRDLATATGGVR